MRFSDRIGVTTPPTLLQVSSIDEPLKNALWQFSRELKLLVSPVNMYAYRTTYLGVYTRFFNLTIDDMPRSDEAALISIRSWYAKAEWFDIYNFVDFLFGDEGTFHPDINLILKEHRSAYRFLSGVLAPISDPVEMEVITSASNLADAFAGARAHISSALAAFSKRQTADYPNAVREAISAVESAAKVVAGNDKADLGVALKTIDKVHGMHPAFKVAVEKLYAYTSDEPGARHARMSETANFDEADAHFMIVTCAAIVNFLVQRYGG